MLKQILDEIKAHVMILGLKGGVRDFSCASFGDERFGVKWNLSREDMAIARLLEASDCDFVITIDDFDDTEDLGDTGCDLQPRNTVERLTAESTHVQILDACLDALSQSVIAGRINDLSTDGDNTDCEAIFHVTGYGYVILKVRK